MIDIATFLNMGGIGLCLFVLWDNNVHMRKSVDNNTRALEKIREVIFKCQR